MQHRTLGSQGLEVSAIGYGAMGLTMAYGPTDAEAGVAALRRAHDLGVTFFDTAEMYGWGTGSNEILVGKAVRDFRDDVVLATKFGVDMSVPPEQIGGPVNSRPDNIRKVADNSLRYLGVEHIDVFYQHRVDPEVPIEEVAGTVKELIDAGKVKYFGLSEAGPETIRKAHAVQPVSVLQTEYSLFERDVEQIFPVLDELGIGFVAYSPLGRGFITGTAKPAGQYEATDIRTVDPRWQPGNFEKNVEAVGKLAELAATKGATVSQLALAWLLTRGEHIVPIPGTRSPKRIEENAGAAGLTLTDADLKAIDEILPQGGFGARYTEGHVPTWI
ncbi:aldo/keto reductase [Streptomyces sp. NPDC127074]|uniref:aldo/keto reductase n=1 Tax=Streptomyces sp. NPDC127074 TaxID=3347130 RepID=UPI00366A2997